MGKLLNHPCIFQEFQLSFYWLFQHKRCHPWMDKTGFSSDLTANFALIIIIIIIIIIGPVPNRGCLQHAQYNIIQFTDQNSFEVRSLATVIQSYPFILIGGSAE